jgi:hypothetical protein
MNMQERYWGFKKEDTKKVCYKCGSEELFELSVADGETFPELNGASCCKDCRDKLYLESFKAIQEETAREEYKQDRERFVEGFTHKYVFWIHPSSGDDFAIEVCSKGKLATQKITAMMNKLKKEHDADSVEKPQIIDFASKYNW